MTISLLKFNFSLVMCPSGHIWWNQFLLPCGGRSAEMFIFSPCFKMPKTKHTEVHWTDKDRFKEVQVNWGTYTHSIQNMKKMRPETNTSILFSIQTGLIDNGPNFPTKNSEAKLYSHPSQSLHYLEHINHFISGYNHDQSLSDYNHDLLSRPITYSRRGLQERLQSLN